MIYEVTIRGTTRTLSVERDGEGYLVGIDGAAPQHIGVRQMPDAMGLLIGERSLDARLVRRDQGWDVDLRGTLHEAAVVDPRRKALRMASGAAQGTLSTSMPGRVVSMMVAVGDHVEAGQPVLVVEAMKMENELKAPVTGEVVEIMVEQGQALEAGSKLIRVKPDEE